MSENETQAPEEKTTRREMEEMERELAFHANSREWDAPADAAAQAALVDVIKALAPIAQDREAVRRVLNAAQDLFVPIALAPGKDTMEALGDFLGTEAGQAALGVVMQLVAASITPTKKPCNCPPTDARAQRPPMPTAHPRDNAIYVVIARSAEDPTEDRFFGGFSAEGADQRWVRRGVSPAAPAEAVQMTMAHAHAVIDMAVRLGNPREQYAIAPAV